MSTEHSPSADEAASGRRMLPERRLPTALRASSHPRPGREAGDAIDGIDWRRIVGSVRRFKWIVLCVTLAGTAAGVAAAGRLDPTYRARATLWIEVPDVRTRDQGPIRSALLLGSTGWVDLLKSQAVLHEVVREQRLYLSFSSDAAAALATFQMREEVPPGAYRLTVAPDGATVTLATDDGAALEVVKVGAAVGTVHGFAWVPPTAALSPGRTIEFVVSTPAAVAERLAEELRVQTDLQEGRVGNFMRLELTGPNPEQVARIVNAIAERFVEVAADLKRQKLTALVAILAEQVRHSQGNLAEAEQALRQFRVGAVTVLSRGGAPVLAGGGRDPAFAEFFDMKVSREQLRRDRAVLERVLAQVPDSGLSVDALETTAAVQHSSALMQGLKELTEKQAMLRALRYRYTEQHPPLRRLAAEIAKLERQTIPALVRGLIAQLDTRRAELGRHVDSVAGGLRQIPPLAIQEERLQRDVTIAEQLFANIQQRYEEARLAEVSSMPEVRILDRALAPQTPLSDIALALVVIAFLGSAALGILGVLVLDRVDSRVRYPEQVTDAMGLPILGAVPHVPHGDAKGDNVAAVIEALRAIRLRVVHAHGTAGPLVVTVTSPGRSDGKSFVTSNLALAFADAGYRTLLIDGDIRRGSLNRVFGVARKPGLTELLAGTVAPDQVLRATEHHALLRFIACGARTQVGPELLTSAPMARLITALRADYDAIFVDSAPLAAGVDAYALGTMTNAMLLVLRTGFSNRGLAEAKLNVLERLPVRVLGAVLNDVRPGPDYRYYSDYLAGYELREETNGAGRPVLGVRE